MLSVHVCCNFSLNAFKKLNTPEALAKLTNFGSSVFAFGYAVTGRTDTTGELLHIY